MRTWQPQTALAHSTDCAAMPLAMAAPIRWGSRPHRAGADRIFPTRTVDKDQHAAIFCNVAVRSSLAALSVHNPQTSRYRPPHTDTRYCAAEAAVSLCTWLQRADSLWTLVEVMQGGGSAGPDQLFSFSGHNSSPLPPAFPRRAAASSSWRKRCRRDGG